MAYNAAPRHRCKHITADGNLTGAPGVNAACNVNWRQMCRRGREMGSPIAASDVLHLRRAVNPPGGMSCARKDGVAPIRDDLELTALAFARPDRRACPVFLFLAIEYLCTNVVVGTILIHDTKIRAHLFQNLALVIRILSAAHPVPHGHKGAIYVLEKSPDPIADCFFDLPFDQAGGEGSERLVQEVVLRFPDSELECVHFHVDALDLEHGRWVVCG